MSLIPRHTESLFKGDLICTGCGDLLEVERAQNNPYQYDKHSKAGSACKVKRWKAQDVEVTVFPHLYLNPLRATRHLPSDHQVSLHHLF